MAPLPADFQDRRVEITGPTDRKMVINALNRWGHCACCARCAAHDVRCWPCQRCLPHLLHAGSRGLIGAASCRLGRMQSGTQRPAVFNNSPTLLCAAAALMCTCPISRTQTAPPGTTWCRGRWAPACLPARLPTCLPSVRLLPASAGGVVLLPPTQHPECRHTCFPDPEHPTLTYRSTCVMPCAVQSASRTSAPASSTPSRR